jgi:hypothetical protein
MGLMDKVKAQAEQALQKSKVAAEKGLEKSKEGIAQGQAKVKDMQAKKAAEGQESTPADGAAKPDAPSGNYSLDDV